jgi:hypothetical protein
MVMAGIRRRIELYEETTGFTAHNGRGTIVLLNKVVFLNPADEERCM